MKKLIMTTLIMSAIAFASNMQNALAQNQNPVASFTPSKLVSCVNEAVDFTNNSYAVYPATSIVKVKWAFGLGSNPAMDTINFSPSGVVFYQSNKYYVTLEVTDNLGKKSSTGVEILVPYWSNPQIYPQNKQSLCTGDSLKLELKPSAGLSYQWTINNVDIVGATDSVYTAKSQGQYGCIVLDKNGCKWSAYSWVSYNTPMNPRTSFWNNQKNGGSTQITLHTGDTLKYCFGSTISVSAQIDSWGPGTSFVWSDGQATNYPMFGMPGSYSFMVTQNGCTEYSDTFNLISMPKPNAIVTAPLDSIYCSGGDTLPVLKLQNNGYFDIIWGQGGNYYNYGGIAVDSFIVSSTGTYGVMVTDANGCSDTSNVFKFTFNPSPNQPTISPDQYQPGCHIWCDNFPGCGYQWLLNDAILVGENTQYMDVSKYGSGFYKVEVTNSSGCSSTSNPNFANCTATGVLEFGEKRYQQVTLSQNPASGNVRVSAHERSEIFLISTSGMVILSADGTEVLFDLQDVPAGLYFVKTVSKDGTSAQKLLVQK